MTRGEYFASCEPLAWVRNDVPRVGHFPLLRETPLSFQALALDGLLREAFRFSSGEGMRR
jgi:hypothetical protein